MQFYMRKFARISANLQLEKEWTIDLNIPSRAIGSTFKMKNNDDYNMPRERKVLGKC